MVERLRSAWKDQRSRSGAKALGLAVSSVFFSPIVTGIVGFIFYFFPYAFSFDFLGSLIVLGIVFFSLQGVVSIALLATILAALFFILLGVKNVFFLKRKEGFIAFSVIVSLGILTAFFSGHLSLVVSGLALGLLFKDLLKGFTNFPGRQIFLSFVLGFVSIEILWALSYLSLSPFVSVFSASLMIFPIAIALFAHLRGELFRGKLIPRLISISFTGLLLAFMGVFGN